MSIYYIIEQAKIYICRPGMKNKRGLNSIPFEMLYMHRRYDPLFSCLNIPVPTKFREQFRFDTACSMLSVCDVDTACIMLSVCAVLREMIDNDSCTLSTSAAPVEM